MNTLHQSQNTHMYKFMKSLNFNSYEELYKYSIEKDRDKDFFWRDLLLYFNVIFEGDCDYVYSKKTFLEYNWFPKLKLNFAENLLNNCGKIYFEHESGLSQILNKKVIINKTAAFQHYISDAIDVGDVVACYMPNIPETVIAMLGTTASGGVFSSVSCDFGADGVIDRLCNLNPKVLVTASSYSYNGKQYCLKKNIEKILKKINFKKVIIVDFLGLNNSKSLGDPWNFQNIDKKLVFTKVKFNSPLYIMFSSGTTGEAKCIVHSVGGTLLQHIKELGLHCDMNRSKNLFYYTTCGWMMWNWLVSSLFFGKITLYEGAIKNFQNFLKIIDKNKINIFGTSPKFLRALEQSGYNNNLKLNSLESILSTGSVLYDEQFDFVDKKVKKGIRLSSISGGTDILGCFMLGNPILPVNKGEITCKGLGMDIDVFDENNEATQGRGELVCKQSFPSQPIYFLNDPDQSKYKESYFSTYKGVWRHGDYIQILKNSGIRVFGRSDYTLNPGGIRIGTSEIYRSISDIHGLIDSICIGINYGSDEVIALFVILDRELDLGDILKVIKTKLTPRHVPKYIFKVNYIPYTKSGKKMESIISRVFNDNKVIDDKNLAEYYTIKANLRSSSEFKGLR